MPNTDEKKKQTESDAVKQQVPQPNAYSSKWQGQMNDAAGQLLNRQPFRYDVNEDALYQQYKDQYIAGGKMAMMDTMGQAQAMTGGYGNSYAQMAGQQAYQGYLQGLNDKVPDLYQQALNQYIAEGDSLLNQYGIMQQMEGTDYDRYMDQLAYEQWLAEFTENQRRYDQEWEAAHPTVSSGGPSRSDDGNNPGVDNAIINDDPIEEEEITFGNVGTAARQVATSGGDVNAFITAAKQEGYITPSQYKSLKYTFGY